MAGAIREHVLAGRDTFIELMTRGEKSGARGVLNNGGTDSWHSGKHSYALTVDEFADARTKEFLAAAVALGVQGVFLSDYGDGNLTSAEVLTRVKYWTAFNDQKLSLKGTAGPQDPTTPGGSPHPDHAAVWSALTQSGWHDIRGYLIYHYGHGKGAPTGTIDATSFCGPKRAALDAYKLWNPSAGRYAVGYHSVPQLIDVAYASCAEYIVKP